jgi:hypothetical protein
MNLAAQFQKVIFDKAVGDILAREGFDKAAKNILDREKARLNRLARLELAEWGKNFELQTELRVLKKCLVAQGTTGRALDSVLRGFSDVPNPLSAYLAEGSCLPGTVARFLNEVRADYERLRSLAEEGGRV